jgi:RND family efflux transporter MFP subunit
VSDKTALLDQLRLERPVEVASSGVWRWWALAVAVVLVGGGAAAWLTLVRAPTVQVATAEVAATPVGSTASAVLDASGYVVARRQATVSAKITGKVSAVLIEEGQRVERDQVIARLDDAIARAALNQALAQREQARANVTAAQVAFDNATPTFRRNEQQFVRAVISAQTFDTAKANFDAARTSLGVAGSALDVAEATLALAQRNLDDTIVRAPFAGVVTVKAAQEGEMVSPNSAGGGFTRTGIGTIVDMESLEIEVDVSENFINRVRAGQRVVAKLNAYPDWDIPAHVIAIIPTADRAKATVKVRVGFESTDERILPQMGVRVSFLEESGAAGGAVTREVVAVPAEAVQANGDTGSVFVVADGRVERRSVRLGARSDSSQLVLSGLTAGTQVVIGELGQLTDGAKVRVAR